MDSVKLFNSVVGGLLTPQQRKDLSKYGEQPKMFFDMVTSSWNLFSIEQWAYVIATTFHETAATFSPVVEAFYAGYAYQQKLKYFPFIGRGYVQITWEKNYAFFGKILGLPLVEKPALAKEPETAFKILTYGFANGSFTGKKISDYVNSDKKDYVNARRCINGVDDAQHIADIAIKLETIIKNLWNDLCLSWL